MAVPATGNGHGNRHGGTPGAAPSWALASATASATSTTAPGAPPATSVPTTTEAPPPTTEAPAPAPTPTTTEAPPPTTEAPAPAPAPAPAEAPPPPAVPVVQTTNEVVGQATWYSAPAGTCASPTLPFGTHVTVTNSANGASTTCVVDDREADTSRVIDLAPATFSQIAPLSEGVITVTLTW